MIKQIFNNYWKVMEMAEHQKLHNQIYPITKICEVCGCEFTPNKTKGELKVIKVLYGVMQCKKMEKLFIPAHQKELWEKIKPKIYKQKEFDFY